MSKNKKKKLTKVERVNCCGNCGFFSIDHLLCVNIDANDEYSMIDLSEDTVCPYFNKDGYMCKTCGDSLKDVETMFVLCPNDKCIYCGNCIDKGIKNYAREIDNDKVEVLVISTDINF
jgi:hypothetical protein